MSAPLAMLIDSDALIMQSSMFFSSRNCSPSLHGYHHISTKQSFKISEHLIVVTEFNILMRRFLSTQQSISVVGMDLSLIPSVSLCIGVLVGLSRKCAIEKRLIGSGCHLVW